MDQIRIFFNESQKEPRPVMNIILISSQRNPLSIKIEKIAFRKKKMRWLPKVIIQEKWKSISQEYCFDPK